MCSTQIKRCAVCLCQANKPSPGQAPDTDTPARTLHAAKPI